MRNFLQHSLDSVYNNLPFHRIVPKALLQTGDPSLTGTGGQAAFPPYDGLPCEHHDRLRFRCRGVVAMVAHAGKIRSQFFITLREALSLDGEHPIFGLVVGDGLWRLGMLEEAGEDVAKVKSVQVEQNPFNDLVPRAKVSDQKRSDTRRVNAKRAVRSNKLLSFARDSDSGSDDEDGGWRGAVRRRPRRTMGNQPRAVTGPSRPTSAPSTKEDVIRGANEEFERLRAQLLSGRGSSAGASGAGTSSASRIESGARGKASKAGEKGAAESKIKADKSVRPAGKWKVGKASGVSASDRAIGLRGGIGKRRKRAADGEMLKRLRGFEQKLREGKKLARKGGKGGKGEWFAKALRLTPGRVEEDEEYEVIIGRKKDEGWKEEDRQWRSR